MKIFVERWQWGTNPSRTRPWMKISIEQLPYLGIGQIYHHRNGWINNNNNYISFVGPLVARSWLIPMWGHCGATWSDWLLGPASFGLVTNGVHPFRDAFHCDLPNARVVWMSVCTPSQGDHDNGYPPSFLLSQMGNWRLKGRCPKDGNYIIIYINIYTYIYIYKYMVNLHLNFSDRHAGWDVLQWLAGNVPFPHKFRS